MLRGGEGQARDGGPGSIPEKVRSEWTRWEQWSRSWTRLRKAHLIQTEDSAAGKGLSQLCICDFQAQQGDQGGLEMKGRRQQQVLRSERRGCEGHVAAVETFPSG